MVMHPFLVLILFLAGAGHCYSRRGGSVPLLPVTPPYHHRATARHGAGPPSQRQLLGRTGFTCSNLHLILRKKQKLTKVISKRIDELMAQETNVAASSNRSRSSIIKGVEFQTRVLSLYQSELNASEEALNVVLFSLNQTLFSDYHSLDIIRLSCESRLARMQAVALLAEGNHNEALRLVQEAKTSSQNSSSQSGHHTLVNDILLEISNAADKLEHQLKDDLFNDLMQGKGKNKQPEIETVVKIKGNDELDPSETDQVLLVDSLNNRYSLSRPRDITVLIDDPHLVKDIILLVIVCSLLGVTCCLLGIPTLFGFGVAGMLLGPAGYNTVKCVVQVETIGEFGAVFIIFMAGLSFSLEKLKKVFKFSMYAAVLLLLVFVLLTLIIGTPLGMKMKQCFFVAVCLSLLSATLINHLIEVISTGSKKRSLSVETIVMSSLEEPEASMVTSLQGLMVVQDVQMASLVALMPFFASSPSNEPATIISYLHSIMRLIQILIGFFLLLLLTHLLAHRVLQPTFRVLSIIKNKEETMLLGSLTICFLLLAVSLFLGASLELGCFLGGMAISTLGHNMVDQIKKLVEPIRDLFSAIFFASVGFHVFPTFLISEFFTIFSVTFCVVVFKFLTSLLLVGLLAGYCHRVTWVTSLSMAHVSEFAFVLFSRARRLGIITREMYLVLLSVTALSLILSPILWRIPYLFSATRKPQSVRAGTPLAHCVKQLIACSKRYFLSPKLNV